MPLTIANPTMYILLQIVLLSSFVVCALSVERPPAPTIKPSYPDHVLAKRDAYCGNLDGKYPNAQVPICAGVTSICAFQNGYQGCCDGSGNCKYYTHCLGNLATETCSDTSCIRCPSTAPYCTKYQFWQTNAGSYEAYSCGKLSLTETIVFGLVGSSTVPASTPTSNTASLSTPSRSGSVSPSSTFVTATVTSSSGSTTSTISISSSTLPSSLSPASSRSASSITSTSTSPTVSGFTSASSNSTSAPYFDTHRAGIIAGIAVAVAVIACLIGYTIWKPKWWRFHSYTSIPHLQQANPKLEGMMRNK